jgi:hypothetical protein
MTLPYRKGRRAQSCPSLKELDEPIDLSTEGLLCAVQTHEQIVASKDRLPIGRSRGELDGEEVADSAAESRSPPGAHVAFVVPRIETKIAQSVSDESYGTRALFQMTSRR